MFLIIVHNDDKCSLRMQYSIRILKQSADFLIIDPIPLYFDPFELLASICSIHFDNLILNKMHNLLLLLRRCPLIVEIRVQLAYLLCPLLLNSIVRSE